MTAGPPFERELASPADDNTYEIFPTLTLHQPFATLVKWSVKRYETRDWKPNVKYVGQRIAIHAGKTVTPSLSLSHETLATLQDVMGGNWRQQIPKGAVLCTAVLSRVLYVSPRLYFGGGTKGFPQAPEGHVAAVDAYSNASRLDQLLNPVFVKVEPWGDFSLNRFLWELEDVKPVSPPYEARGQMGLFNLGVPTHLLED